MDEIRTDVEDLEELARSFGLNIPPVGRKSVRLRLFLCTIACCIGFVFYLIFNHAGDTLKLAPTNRVNPLSLGSDCTEGYPLNYNQEENSVTCALVEDFDDSYHDKTTNTQRITIPPYHKIVLRSGNILDGEGWVGKGTIEVTCVGYKGDHTVWITRRNDQILVSYVVEGDTTRDPSVSTIWEPSNKNDFVMCHSV